MAKPQKPQKRHKLDALDVLALGRESLAAGRRDSAAPRAKEAESVNAGDFAKELAAVFGRIAAASPAAVAKDRETRRVLPYLIEAGIAEEHRKNAEAINQQPKWAGALGKVRDKLAENPGAIVALIGPRGTGKSQMAAQLVRDFADRQIAIEDANKDSSVAQWNAFEKIRSLCPLIRKFIERRVIVPLPPRCRYLKAAFYFGRNKELYANVGTINAEVREQEIEVLSQYDLVTFDELQEAAEGDENRRIGFGKILTDIVDRRYAKQRPTILISNHYDMENPDNFAPIQNFLGASICDRMRQTGGIVVCNWRSFRER